MENSQYQRQNGADALDVSTGQPATYVPADTASPPHTKEHTNLDGAEQIPLTINGQEVYAARGTTILEAARAAGIEIPTLCNGAKHPCNLCVVEIDGKESLVRACDTPVDAFMWVMTESPRVRTHRKQVLELKLSHHYGDCLSPCALNCPAGINIQGYISLIRRGMDTEALELIKKKNPLPLTISRVCPHPCEAMCRRILVEDRIPINHLKRFVSDQGITASKREDRPIQTPTGHRIAVVGGGPAGLSAAYYLAKQGHGVTIFEAMPELGGMLRYAIPEYRLPRKVLEREIADILQLGIEVRTGRRLGIDFTLNGLKEAGFAAVFLATGAWDTRCLDVDGEDLDGVDHALDFLREVRTGSRVRIGKKVAVIGGGNSALDVARTCVRLGAQEVSIVYRRSRPEMPAREQEVREAVAEGVKLFLVATPSKITKSNARLKLEVLRTALGEPDQTGRRRPIPLAGSEQVIEVDNVITAIGQRPDLSFVDSTEGSRPLASHRQTLFSAPGSYQTNMNGVFAGGDAVTGPGTVVEAVATGRKAADAIHAYVEDHPVTSWRRKVNVAKGRNLHDVSLRNFDHVPNQPPEQLPERPVKIRRKDFSEYVLGFSEDMARREADRCLNCGCMGLSKCELRGLVDRYDADLSASDRPDKPLYAVTDDHPFITIDPNKCVFCQRCETGCPYGAMELDGGGFDDRGRPRNLTIRMNDRCVSCGRCVDSCPTGALVKKCVPFPVEPADLRHVRTVCNYCGCGCSLTMKVQGRTIVEIISEPEHGPNLGNTCVKGRFGHGFVNHPDRLTAPLVRQGAYFVETSWEKALELVANRFAELKTAHGPQTFAGLSSAKCTNEENYLMQKFVRAAIGTNNIDHCARL